MGVVETSDVKPRSLPHQDTPTSCSKAVNSLALSPKGFTGLRPYPINRPLCLGAHGYCSRGLTLTSL